MYMYVLFTAHVTSCPFIGNIFEKYFTLFSKFQIFEKYFRRIRNLQGWELTNLTHELVHPSVELSREPGSTQQWLPGSTSVQ